MNADLFELPSVHCFPDTKYMGSKARVLPFIMDRMRQLRFKSAFDAFSGSGCVSYALKEEGKQVFSNDFLSFCFHTARATVENSAATLSDGDVKMLCRENPDAGSFVARTLRQPVFQRNGLPVSGQFAGEHWEAGPVQGIAGFGRWEPRGDEKTATGVVHLHGA